MALTYSVKSTLLVAGMVMSAGAVAEAQNVIVQDVKLNSATIFLRGAELFNSATLTLPAGASEIVLSNVANNINPASLSVILNNDDVTIQSVNLRSEAKEPVYPADINALKAQIDTAEQAVAQLNMFIQVNNEQLGLLRDQDFFGSSGALSTEQSVQKLAFIREQMIKIYGEQLSYQKQISDKTEEITRLKALFAEKTARFDGRQPQIVVSVAAKKAVTAELDIAYITADAAWAPAYDIRTTGLDKPVTLTYKANVIQNTGINWDQVKLTLSSADPVQTIAPPQLFPWYLAQVQDYETRNMMADMVAAPAPMVMAGEKSAKNKKVSRGIADFVSTDSNGISLSYTIAQPYSLPSSQESRSLTIKQTELTGKYRYITRPKLDEHVYLQADIDNALALNLLSGNANIYFADRYIGTSFIDAATLTDKLAVPFGMNKDIQVTRTVNAKLKKQPGILGSAVEQSEGYIIRLKSVYSEPVTVHVFDQLPVSQDSKILVKDMEFGDGKLDKKTGEIEWEVTLKPQQEVELPLNYTLKYPKDTQIYGL